MLRFLSCVPAILPIYGNYREKYNVFSHLKLREGEIVRTDYFKKVITSLQLCHVQPLLTSNLGFVSLMILNLSHSPGFALDTG
ncbi:MAG: hypothetical protein ACKO86_07005, partial [Dolichospermum sp.]